MSISSLSEKGCFQHSHWQIMWKNMSYLSVYLSVHWWKFVIFHPEGSQSYFHLFKVHVIFSTNCLLSFAHLATRLFIFFNLIFSEFFIISGIHCLWFKFSNGCLEFVYGGFCPCESLRWHLTFWRYVMAVGPP